MKMVLKTMDEFKVDHEDHYDMMLRQAWNNLKHNVVFSKASLPFNERAYHHRPPDGRHRQWSKKWIKRLPRGVWLRNIAKSNNTYSLTVYLEKMDREVTVKADGKTCPYDDLIAKVYVFL